MKILFSHFAFLLLTVSLNLPAQKVYIHVSPQGDDNNTGTAQSPVATLQQAVKQIKAQREKQEIPDTITLFLHKGVYRTRQGILLDEEVSGSERSPVIFSNYNNEKVVLSGAVLIRKYRSLSHTHFLYKKNPAIGKKIIVIDLRQAGIDQAAPLRLAGFSGSNAPKKYALKELYFNGKAMPLARWPDKGFSTFSGIISDTSGTEKITGIRYNDKHISSWKNEPNILLHGYWKYLWADAYESVTGIDTVRRILWLKPPYNHYGFKQDRPFAAINVIAEIDRPGEWACDYRENKIYFYPPDDPVDAEIELAVSEKPLIELNHAQWVSVSGITFEKGAAAGLRITGSTHIQIKNCIIHGFARDGIVMKKGDHNTISHCEIYDLGRGGLIAAGGDRETLESAAFLIDHCHIHHLSRIDRTYTPGIWVDGVGTTITHCKIHDVPSSAMRINGNDHTIEYNELFYVVTESDDQGAIDMWGDPTYRGNVFRYNYIHDTGPRHSDRINATTGRAGIRFDDAISGNLVFGNIFKNCSGGHFGAIQIHGGKENLIRNNLFYKCENGISFTPWSPEHWKKYNQHSLAFLEEHKELYVRRYPALKNINDSLNRNRITNNVFLECRNTTLRQPRTVIFQDNLILKDYPDGADPEKERYSLHKITGELKKIAFKPIPFEKIGLTLYH